MSYLQCRGDVNPLEALLHDDFLSPFVSKNFYPSLDVVESKDKYTLQIDLPGLKKEDIKVSFDNGVLVVEGQRQVEAEDKEKSYRRVERAYGYFNRTVQLGLGVDGSAIKAQYSEGVLTLDIPKLEKAQTKVITVD